jgi:bifunctional DNase/RNase
MLRNGTQIYAERWDVNGFIRPNPAFPSKSACYPTPKINQTPVFRVLISSIFVLSMKKIELEIVALSHSITQTHSYAVVLGEMNGLRRLPIVIGGFEAQAIAVALEHMQPSRPLTHDLMKNFMNAFGVELQEIIISDLQEGIFYSKLVCFTENDTVEIDSRTSDALALAVRFGCPVYTYEHILENAGILMEDGAEKKIKGDGESEGVSIEETGGGALTDMNLEELQTLLNNVLEQEDYIRAISIRDEINKRK